MNRKNQIDQLSPLQKAVVALKELRAKLDAAEYAKSEPLAIIGLGCRFPGTDGDCSNPRDLWQMLRSGGDAVSEIPADRWDVDAYYDPDPETPGKMHTRWGGFLTRIDQFDPQFFGISPREAVSMDPQQRLMLEVSWEALEHAGQAPDRLHEIPTGMFIGIGIGDYGQMQMRSGQAINAYSGTGTGFCFASGRLSYFYRTQGPSLSVDTACSSSLVAVHLACQSLRNRECRMALAGGVNIMAAPEATLFLAKSHALSPTGRCRTFDAGADGFVRGEGCGVVVLKRLSDAKQDGDRILALIRGSAINHDGPSSGLTVPNGQAQQRLLRQALSHARLDPAEVSYIEAHGTGTELGDPIELRAMAAVYGKDRAPEGPLTIGSIKTNVGHLEAAAGVAGIIKSVLCLQHREFVPHLFFEQPTPHFSWAVPFRVTTEPEPWMLEEGKKRIAGVSSFGLSGTNAHVLIEEAPQEEVPAAEEVRTKRDRPLHILTLSAKEEEPLRVLASSMADCLEHSADSLGDVCFTANDGRAKLPYRLAVTAESAAKMRDQLSAFVSGEAPAGIHCGEIRKSKRLKTAFLFSGQGSQYENMGLGLYRTQPVFRQALEQCQELLQPHLEKSLLSVLFPKSDEGESLLDQTAYCQPALFALGYALGKMWRSWGIEPEVVMGHSVGEYTAACFAGVFDLEDGLKLTAARGRLMQSLPSGGVMTALANDEAAVREQLRPFSDRVAIAAVNGPKDVVISGEGEAVEAIVALFGKKGVRHRKLAVSHAFHSPLMEPMLTDFEEVARQVTFRPPRIGFISNVTGTLATDEVTEPEYWMNHVRRPVLFSMGMEALLGQKYDLFLELGPQATLLGMARRCLPESSQEETSLWLPSLRRRKEDWQQVLDSLAAMYVYGYSVDWRSLDRDHRRRRVPLPTYPFQRQGYWLAPSSKTALRSFADGERLHPLLAQRFESPALEHRHVVFESQLAPDVPRYLRDHRILGEVVLPATGFFEMALAGAREILGSGGLQLAECVIHQPLLLSPQKTAVQMVVTHGDASRYDFQIFSSSDDDEGDQWNLNASGAFCAPEAAKQADAVELESLLQGTPVSVTDYFERALAQGVDFGPDFRAIEEIREHEGRVFGRIRVPETLVGEAGDYLLHPVLLDACFQTLGAAFGEEDADGTFLPSGLERLTLSGRLGREVWSEARFRPGDHRQLRLADLRLFDEEGTVVARVEGVVFQRTSLEAWTDRRRDSIASWCYRLEWRAKPASTSRESSEAAGCYLLLADEGDAARQLAKRLQGQGIPYILALPGEGFEKRSATRFVLDPVRPEGFRRLIEDVSAEHGTSGFRVVHMWGLNGGPREELDLPTLERRQELGCASALHLVQALRGVGDGEGRRLWLVTRGAQSVDGDGRSLDVAQGPLWGLGQVVALEHPELKCIRLDLDPSLQDDGSALWESLTASDQEDQVAYRRGQRYVARLVRHESAGARKPPGPLPPRRLATAGSGILDNLFLDDLTRRRPGPGEVEIEVRATGLNFKDVLLAMGAIPGQTSDAELLFGGECSGTVAAVGEGVSHLRVGDEAIAFFAPGSMANFVTVDAMYVARKPASLTFEEAATVSITFLTALYGFQLAGLGPGMRVLVHAAAGGVGQAAVQLAHRAGAEVFATASAPKHDFLRSVGVRHVMDSRTLDYAEEIISLTGGRGVDVILNSLRGEYIPKNLEILAEGGRFVEMGKLGIWSQAQVHEKRPDVKYFPYDLSELAQSEPNIIAPLVTELTKGLEEGSLKPLPYRTFTIQESADAFRYMAHAKHIGKLVITHPVPITDAGVADDASYLITGGLGALGRQVARWLADRGARNLVLAGRSEPSEAALEFITALEQTGVRVLAAQADVAREEDVADLLQQIETEMPALHGIVHAAGVLDDGVLTSQTWERFRDVLAPKLAGTWNLHVMTRHLPLDFFVYFSSVASLLGSPGQGNYSAANAFMDAMAHHRRALGLPALSINWGSWAGAGMAADQDDRSRVRQRSLYGLGTIQPEEGLEGLRRLLGQNAAQVGLFSMDWSRFLQSPSLGGSAPFYEALRRSYGGARAKTPGFRQQLEEMSPKERRERLVTHVRSLVAAVLGLSAEQLGLRHRLFDLGIDSLMALELKNRLEAGFEVRLPQTFIFDYPMVEAIVDYLAEELPFDFSLEADGEPGGVSVSELVEIDQLSEEGAEALLLQELEKQNL